MTQHSLSHLAASELLDIPKQSEQTRDFLVHEKPDLEFAPHSNFPSQKLSEGIKRDLGIEGIRVEMYQRYYIEGWYENDENRGLSDDELNEVLPTIFCELPTQRAISGADIAQKGEFIEIEDQPGMFNARTDSVAKGLLGTFRRRFDRRVKSTTVVQIVGDISVGDRKKIENYLHNPKETRIRKHESKLFPDALKNPEGYERLEGFIDASNPQEFLIGKGVKLDAADAKFLQEYFKSDTDREHSDPSRSEIEGILTYWSDHCRHTTMNTRLENIEIRGEGALPDSIRASHERLQQYIREKNQKKSADEEDLVLTLMNVATAGGKILQEQGISNFKNTHATDENNACSYETEITLEDGSTETYVILFKNETHNSPTDASPFGGAATCIGGAIRDTMSGRAWTFQAIRKSGIGNPTEPISQKHANTVAQTVLGQMSAVGHSSYGNQMGIPALHIQEQEHPGYHAKKYELGYVCAAVPKKLVKYEKPKKGDRVLLIGGRTGKDGVGGARVASVAAGDGVTSEEAANHVQNGDPLTEGALARLFLNPKFIQYVKRCNDFGAGGVAVAVGEIASGVRVDLDKLHTKQEGMTDWQKFISESQERMAIVIEDEHYDAVMNLIAEANLDSCDIAEVTADEGDANARLEVLSGGQKVVDLQRSFLDSAGGQKVQEQVIIDAKPTKFFTEEPECLAHFEDETEKFLGNLERPNVSIGGGWPGIFDDSVQGLTVLGRMSGKYQRTPGIAAVSRVPTFHREDGLQSVTAVISALGGRACLSDASPYLQSMYSVIEAISRVVAVGGDIKKTWLSLQEYFGRLEQDSIRWGGIYQSMLGAFQAQVELMVAAIGGKDSANGTAVIDGETLHVPTTIDTFANCPVESDKVVGSAFRGTKSGVYRFSIQRDESGVPDWEATKVMYAQIHDLHATGKVFSASVIGEGGEAAEIAKMCYGNDIGFAWNEKPCYLPSFGDIILEIAPGTDASSLTSGKKIGETNPNPILWVPTDKMNPTMISLKDAHNASTKRYREVYPTSTGGGPVDPIITPADAQRKIINGVNIITGKPRVIIPVFPGTNSEYEIAQSLTREGFEVELFTVLTEGSHAALIQNEIDFAEKVGKCQSMVLAGGFSYADLPSGSGSGAAIFLRNPRIREALDSMLGGGGLIFGECNGFQIATKSGLIEHGRVTDFQNEGDFTLAPNTTRRHMTGLVRIRVTSIVSPFTTDMELGEEFVIPSSHAEGLSKFSSEQQFQQMEGNGQIVAQYLDANGHPSNEYNGSHHGVAGMTSPNHQIFGMMPHMTRVGLNTFRDIPDVRPMPIFASMARALGGKPGRFGVSTKS